MRNRFRAFTLLSLAISGFTIFNATAQCSDPVPSVLKITNDSVTITWPAVTNAIGYEYVVQLASLPQPTTGTPTTATLVGVGSLPYAPHKAWVRTDCGTSVLSNWASISFTIVCSKPGSINIANIGEDSAAITWSQVASLTSYEYVLDQSASDPAGAGTPISGNAYTPKGLTAGTQYFMHVRTDCGGGTFSAWSIENFRTLYPAGITATGYGSTIKAYPNPVTDNLFIKLQSSSTGGNISVTNIAGVTVHQSIVTNNELSIDMRSLVPGIYILKYSNEQGTTYSKIMKQ
jgi:hypothetical protein